MSGNENKSLPGVRPGNIKHGDGEAVAGDLLPALSVASDDEVSRGIAIDKLEIASNPVEQSSETDVFGEHHKDGASAVSGQDGLVPAETLNLYALSWRSSTGILHEHINFRARDEEDLLERFGQKIPRDQRTGQRGPSLGPGSRRVVDDPDDSLQWVWQPVGISLADTTRSLSQLYASVPSTKK